MNLAHNPHLALLHISEVFANASDDLASFAESVAGRNFPHEQVARLHDDPSFENLEVAHAAVTGFADHCGHSMRLIGAEMHTDLEDLLDKVNQWVPFRAKLMTEYQRDDAGNTKAIPHFYPKGQGERFHSLGNAAIVGGIDVSVFDKPLRAEAVYPGKEALEAYENKTAMPAPSGTVASYKIAILDGEIRTPALWPLDLLRAQQVDDEMDMTP